MLSIQIYSYIRLYFVQLLYRALRTSHFLRRIVLKIGSKCSCIAYTLRFFADFCLILHQKLAWCEKPVYAFSESLRFQKSRFQSGATFLLSAILCLWCTTNFAEVQANTFDIKSHFNKLHQKYPSIDTALINAGLKAYVHALEENITTKSILTVVDYSKPSNEKRLLVIDLKTDTILFKDYVSHGSRSGDRYATQFSNRPGSHQSSYGVFLTEAPYVGSRGYSLRLRGLEKGINDKAKSRAIVVHSAWYVTKQFAKRYGRIGRSFGCFAVNTNIIKPLINKIRDGSLFIVFYPSRAWLSHSDFLT